MSGVMLWGWDTANWQKVRTNAAGNLEIVPAAAAVFPSHCYGWDTANWQELRVESAASPNLRTRLYDGVNPVVSVGTAADIADANRGLFTQAGVRGWDGTFWKSVNVEDGAGDAVANDRASLDVFSRLYGYNGATWDRLRVMTPADAFVTPTMALQVSSFLMGYDGADWNMVRVDAAGQLQVDVLSAPTTDVNTHGWDGTNWQKLLVETAVSHNLRVRLYIGGTAVGYRQTDVASFVGADWYGLISVDKLFLHGAGNTCYAWKNANQQLDGQGGVFQAPVSLYGWNGAAWDRLRVGTPAYAYTTPTFALEGMSFLMGYNGATWDMLTMQSSTRHNLRVALYFDGSVVQVGSISADGIATGTGTLRVSSFLYGYNGASWDRLRTYGTGILKVGRAEVGLLDVRMTAVGQVGAVGARKLYWMTMNPTAANSVIELTDAVAGGAAVKWDMTHGVNSSHHMNLDPPLEFTNGIYLETFTNMTSVIFGYL